MRKKFGTVGLGGTFDELHKGHRALLMKAFNMGERVIIGVSSDEFVRTMNKLHRTARYEQRTKELEDFLKHLDVLQRAEIIPIDDTYGGVLLSKDPIEALVVSRETEPVARRINEKRKEIGIGPLEIVVINMVPSENHKAISTTRIRAREIDREGHVLKQKAK
ncbi:MAG TPA: pantetheine-phosphate adenylyltransferase [candidate division Zixibacteria bacterium]|nr:pantetheine-phosphate adenylyltransferase [candidate division Zixibacteria bacterium]